MGIVVIGSTFVDIKGFPEGSFLPTGRNAGRVEEMHGGVSRNIAENLANLGLQSTLVTLLDESAAGAAVLERLQQHKVHTEYIRKTENGMGTWLAVFDTAGDVYASVSRRPDLMPILDILEAHGEEIFQKADAITMDFDMEREIVEKILLLAKQYNRPVYGAVSNMTIAMERRDLLQALSCFICNQQESEQLFLEDYSGKTREEMAEILAEKVKQEGIRRIVVTMGEEGAAFAEADGTSGCCPAEKVEVRDTTGAGDAFFSGAAAALSQGRSLREACGVGTRLSAAVIQTTENVCPLFHPEQFGLTAGPEC